MEREAVLVGIDVGTSKVCALIGEVSRDGRLTIMGHGTVPASGLKKGVVINIDQTVRSIADAVERAERLSGWKIDRAFVGVGGQHVESLNSPGQVAVTGHHREVAREDVNRAIEVARAVPIPSNREVLHVERRGFSVDGQEGVKDPLGMSALRLEVETHIVTASATAVQNLSKCVAAAGVKIDELVVNSLASADAVLNETEKELGVAVADIGAGTIDLALFQEGSPFHTRVLPVGGNNVTNDVAIGLKTSLAVAEELKIRHGSADLKAVSEDEEISVSVLGEEAGRTVSRLEVCQIIEARMRETFELLRNEIRAAGVRQLPAGIILTGGAAQLSGIAELGREVLEMPVRVAGADEHRRARRHAADPGLLAPASGCSSGARRRSPAGSRCATSRRPRWAASAGSATPSGASSRRHPGAHGPDRFGARRGRPDRGLHGVPRRHRRGDGLLSIFVPHATAGLVIVEVGAGSDDDLLDALDRLLPREDRLYRHRHGSPGHGADHVLPLLAPPSLTVPVLDGRHGARDVAVDLPAGPERRQREPDGPAQLPRRLTAPRRDGAPMHRPSRAATDFPIPTLAGRRYTPAQPKPIRPDDRPPGPDAPPPVVAHDPEGRRRKTRCRCVPIPRTSR